MAEEQQVEVAIEDAAPEAPVEVVQEPKQPEAQDETVAELKRQYQELQAKDEANRREIETRRQSEEHARALAQRAVQEVQHVREQVVDSDLSAVTSAIAAATAEAESATREYQSAFDAADGLKLAEAQRKIARAEAKLQRFEGLKSDIEANRVTTQGRVEQPRPYVNADPFETAIANLSPKLKSWLRAHPDVVTDSEMRAKAAWVDQAARKRGYSPDRDVDAYIAFAEQELYPQQRNQQQNLRPRSMPAAPPSRANGSDTVTGKSEMIKLTPGEVQAATDGTLLWNTGPNKGKPLGVPEMARRKSALLKDGAYKRSLQG